MELNHFQVLGVRPDANPVEIKMAYEAIKSTLEEDDIESQLEINVAYQVLMNPRDRAEYTAQLMQQPVAQIDPEPVTVIRSLPARSAAIEFNFGYGLQFVLGFVATVGVMFIYLLTK